MEAIKSNYGWEKVEQEGEDRGMSRDPSTTWVDLADGEAEWSML